MGRMEPHRVLLWSGLALIAFPWAVAPSPEVWVVELVQWLGALLALLGLCQRSMLGRGIDSDGVVRWWTRAGVSAALAGMVTDHRIFLIVGFAFTAGAVSRASALIGFDAQTSMLRRLEEGGDRSATAN